VLFDLVREVNRLRADDEGAAAALAGLLRQLGGVLGILQSDPDAYLRGASERGGLSDAEIDALIGQRRAARQAKQWAEADRIRDALSAAGVVLEDGAQGTIWRRG
jgi:cysteinyl-tRNA synthetase